MRDQAVIYGGLVAFLGLITFPFAYGLAGGRTSKPPDLRLPVQETQCVAPLDYMKSSHMKLLLDWRDSVVRENRRNFAAFDNREYTMSLSGTCLKNCHTSKADFCDRCHSYAGVQGPYCMDCHVDPGQDGRSGL